MKLNVNQRNTTVNLALTGLMAALVMIGYFLSIRFPLMGAKAQIGFGNVFGILSGLLLGPIYGGLAAGLGGFLYDMLSGWADSAVITLFTKFIMAFVAGIIAWGPRGNKELTLKRVIIAAITGSVTYSLLYLGHGYIEGILMGNSKKALTYILGVKVTVTFINALIADVISIPLFIAIHKALKRNHFIADDGPASQKVQHTSE